jgi:exodeoxyribonuclease VII large subunit
MENTVLQEVSDKPAVLSVGQLNLQIKQLLEGNTGILWVQGEISNFKAHTSGHYYFSLKDKNSQISAVMFRGSNGRLKFKPTDGMEVLVRGKISVYEPRGNYQIVCDVMEPVGAGALQKAFEQLKAKLKDEGLFDSERKRPIPHFPRHIAIVTSPTGAAIRDMMNVLGRRARGIEITIVPTIVQGAAAAPQICEALKKAWALPNVDVVIMGRGGGSIEDMWCFNDEALARLIVQSPVPVISAVGHEIDFTIADFVADLRAPTPSAAAELVAKSADELMHKVQQLQRMLVLCHSKSFEKLKQKLNHLARRLVDPQKKLQDLSQRNDELLMRLDLARKNIFERKRQKLKHSMAMLDSLSPLKVVDRGYALVTKDSKVIKSVKEVKKGDVLNVQLSNGKMDVTVTALKGE